MFVPSHVTPANLDSLPDSIVDTFVCYNDISSLAERWDDTRDGTERLRIDDTRLRAQERRNICFNFHMHILRAIESRRTAGPYSVCAQRLYCPLFKVLVRRKIEMIVARKICDRSAVG